MAAPAPLFLDPAFSECLSALHGSFRRLVEMKPVTIATLPRDAPLCAIYLFSEAGQPLYVGRTRRQSLRQRLRQHSIDSAQHNQAVFAFKLAREVTGRVQPTYTPEDTRAVLAKDPQFALAFMDAKVRIRKMELRYVEETDPLRQTLLEIYAAVVLKTPYNDFDTH